MLQNVPRISEEEKEKIDKQARELAEGLPYSYVCSVLGARPRAGD